MAEIDTGTNDLLACLDDGVLTLTLNRPEARNAMSGPMNDALADKLAWAELAPEVKVVVLTGAGQGFCAGGDVKIMDSRNTGAGQPVAIDEAIHRQRVNQRATSGKLFKIPKPTIAALPSGVRLYTGPPESPLWLTTPLAIVNHPLLTAWMVPQLSPVITPK